MATEGPADLVRAVMGMFFVHDSLFGLSCAVGGSAPQMCKVMLRDAVDRP